MVKLNDEMMLNASAISAGAFAVGLLAAPTEFNKQMFTAKSLIKDDHPFFSHTGVLAATLGVMSTSAAKADRDTRKKFLKIAGTAWLAHSAIDAIHIQRGTQKREGSLIALAGEATLGTLSLIAGFQKDDE